MKHVTLKLIEGIWYAQFHDCPCVVAAFGSPFVRTPYSHKHEPGWVLIEVLLVLDNCVVSLEVPKG